MKKITVRKAGAIKLTSAGIASMYCSFLCCYPARGRPVHGPWDRAQAVRPTPVT